VVVGLRNLSKKEIVTKGAARPACMPRLPHAVLPTQAAFLNVLYKALSVDPSANRIRAFVKRLLQLAMGQNPPFACATLYLVSELSKVKPVIFSMVTQPEGDDEERFVDAPDSDAEPANGTLQYWDLWPIACCLFPRHAAFMMGFGHNQDSPTHSQAHHNSQSSSISL
jgi:hypothetical protein